MSISTREVLHQTESLLLVTVNEFSIINEFGWIWLFDFEVLELLSYELLLLFVRVHDELRRLEWVAAILVDFWLEMRELVKLRSELSLL